MMKTIHMRIDGKVQGVFFRGHVKQEADRLSIMGWVHNTEDGGLEIMAQGPAAAMEEFVLHCKQGPSRALVRDIEIVEVQQPQETFSDFRVLY